MLTVAAIVFQIFTKAVRVQNTFILKLQMFKLNGKYF